MARNLKGSIVVKYIIAKHGPITTQQIVSDFLPKFPVLQSKAHIKTRILNKIWDEVNVLKVYNPEVLNPVTKKGTWFWELSPKLKEMYGSLNDQSVEQVEIPPERSLKPADLVPLLGRTGPFSHFPNAGALRDEYTQKL